MCNYKQEFCFDISAVSLLLMKLPGDKEVDAIEMKKED
jgi:hypothetical protein